MSMSHNKNIPAISTSNNRAISQNSETPAYSLRPRKNGQVVHPRNAAEVLASENFCSLSLDSLSPEVVLEDISDICVTVQSSELDSLVSNHSADPLLANDKGKLLAMPERFPISWPSMSEDSKWNTLNEAITKHLSTASKNLSVGSRIQFLETILYECASNAFGHAFPSAKPPRKSFSCPKKDRTIQLVKTKNHLLLQMEVNPSEREGLVKLLEETRSELRQLRKTGNRRKKRWLRNRQRKSFKANPYKCGKDLLRPKNFSKLSIPTADLDRILKSMHSDPSRDVPLPPLDGLPDPPVVDFKFDASTFSSQAFGGILRSRRNASRPGPNAIPYKLYKKCPGAAKYLFQLLCDCLRLKRVPLQWRIAFKTFIPKVEDPDSSSFPDFRDIALLNVEGKIFFSLISKRFHKHLVEKNKFIDTSVQKGCMKDIPGCWEHIAMVWDALKDARLNRRDLVSIWLDIANAYGSIPHKLIFFALRRYGIPEKWISIVETYYYSSWSKAVSEGALSSWHRHERGIFTGCCLSIILFLAGMNVVIEYICNTEVQRFVSSSKVLMPLVRAFMDDLNLLTSSSRNMRGLLKRASTALNWAGMEFRAKKSRYLLMKGGRVTDSEFVVGAAEKIPSITVKPIRSLGKTIDASVSDKEGSTMVEEAIIEGITSINNSLLLGTSKVWILQFLLLPQIRWILMIYEIPLSTVERFEKRISRFIRKWLGFHPTISSLALYSKESPCPLPITSLTSLFKTTKASAQLQLRDSSDPIIASSTPNLYTGAKWRVSDAVQDADSILHFRKIQGHTQTNKAGLGWTPSQKIPDIGTKEYRKALSDTVSRVHDQQNVAIEEGKKLQNSWTEWSSFVRNDLTWKCIWAYGPNLVKFCVQSCFNTLPSPNNLIRWKTRDFHDPSCSLCKTEPMCTLPHILSGCKFSLRNKRYSFRHDSVVKVFVEGVVEQIGKKLKSSSPTTFKVKFVSPGEVGQPKHVRYVGLLDRAKDWIVLADVGSSQLIFPVEIFATSDRPDVVIYSRSKKIVILIENTSGCEENHSERHAWKIEKYKDLVGAIQSAGWSCHFFAIEVGARGFNSTHVPFCLKSLGFPPKSVKEMLKKLGYTALQASYQIWLAHDDVGWKPPAIKWQSNLPSVPQPPTLVPSKSPTVTAKSATTTLPSSSPSEHIHFDVHQVPPESVGETRDHSSIEVASDLPGTSKGLSNGRLRRPSVGLVNLGNTCYANAILVCMFSLPELWEFPSTSSLLQSLRLVLMTMNSHQPSLRPMKFLTALKNHMTGKQRQAFRWNQQHDPSEVLGYVLDEVRQATHNLQLVSSHLVPTYCCLSCSHKGTVDGSSTESRIINLQVSESVSKSVQLLLSGSKVSRFCASCNRDQLCNEKLTFTILPDVLIFRLTRDQFCRKKGFKKLRDKVKCDKVVHMPSGDVLTPDITNYNLISVIHHTGDNGAGHCTATIVNGNKQGVMWRYNDSQVSKVTKLDERSAYILFYRKSR